MALAGAAAASRGALSELWVIAGMKCGPLPDLRSPDQAAMAEGFMNITDEYAHSSGRMDWQILAKKMRWFIFPPG
jgi:hypothetical protein